jgi:hypothetical protein
MISISIPNHQRMEFIFHNLYVILGFVPIVAIYWMAQLLTQKIIKQDYVAPRFKSSLQNVVSANWSTVAKYLFLKLQDIFSIVYIFFFTLSPRGTLPDLTMSKTAIVKKIHEPLAFRGHLRSVFSHHFSFLFSFFLSSLVFRHSALFVKCCLCRWIGHY